jgi:hypothetical protein
MRRRSPTSITCHISKELTVPTYMDEHDIPGVTAAAVAEAHEADVRVQGAYGVNYKQYWVDEEAGKVFCLVDAPDRETATRVHREAHGLEAHTLHQVEQGG